MNELSARQWHKVAAVDVPSSKPYLGLVYVIEYGDGIKIGMSSRFKKRLVALRKQERYGGLSVGTYRVTQLCTNYKEIEKQLHEYFREFRKSRTELFSLSLKEFLQKVPVLDFKDDGEVLMARDDARLSAMKRLIANIGTR